MDITLRKEREGDWFVAMLFLVGITFLPVVSVKLFDSRKSEHNQSSAAIFVMIFKYKEIFVRAIWAIGWLQVSIQIHMCAFKSAVYECLRRMMTQIKSI